MFSLLLVKYFDGLACGSGIWHCLERSWVCERPAKSGLVVLESPFTRSLCTRGGPTRARGGVCTLQRFNARPSPCYLRSSRRFSLINPDKVASSVVYVAGHEEEMGKKCRGVPGGLFCAGSPRLSCVTRFFGFTNDRTWGCLAPCAGYVASPGIHECFWGSSPKA